MHKYKKDTRGFPDCLGLVDIEKHHATKFSIGFRTTRKKDMKRKRFRNAFCDTTKENIKNYPFSIAVCINNSLVSFLRKFSPSVKRLELILEVLTNIMLCYNVSCINQSVLTK